MAKSGFMFGKAALLTFLYPSAENTFNITMEAQVAPVRYIKTSSVKSRRCRAWILVVTFFFFQYYKTLFRTDGPARSVFFFPLVICIKSYNILNPHTPHVLQGTSL